jgi:hypothetical protein
MIKLIFLTDNTKRRNISKRYYVVDDQGRFIEDVSDIALDNRLTWKQALSIVRSSCVALSTSQKCEICREPRGNSHHSRVSADIGRWTRIHVHDIKKRNGKILMPLHRPQPLRTLLWRSVSSYSRDLFRTSLKDLNGFLDNWSAADCIGLGFQNRIVVSVGSKVKERPPNRVRSTTEGTPVY